MLSEQDRSYLQELLDCARFQILPLATSGNEVQAIGEFWEGVELWMQDRQDEVGFNVSIGIYCREGDPKDFLEHLHVDARVNDTEVRLDTLGRTYTPQVGSDHHTEDLARLTKIESLSKHGVGRWFELFKAVLGHESRRVSVSRDHL